MGTRTILVFVGLGLATLSPAGCLPATSPFDPDAPLELQAPYTVTGRVLLKERCEWVAPSSGRLRVAIDEREFVEPVFAGGDEEVDPEKLGRFSIEMSPGPHTLRFVDSTGQARIEPPGTEERVFEVSGLPGEVVDLTPGDELIHLVERVPPTPFSVQTPGDVLRSAAVTVVVDGHASDPQGNLDRYQFRSAEVLNWDTVEVPSSPDEGDEVSWTTPLTPNSANLIAWRALDCEGNVGPQNFAFVRHDDSAPASPDPLRVKEGNERLDLYWAEDNDAEVVYEVDYGLSEQFGGQIADQGPSPISTLGGHLRLTGLVNGAPLYVRVRALDAAGNETRSEVMRAVPDVITPELVGQQTLSGGTAIAHAKSGDQLYVLLDTDAGNERELQLFDVSSRQLAAGGPGLIDTSTAYAGVELEGAVDVAAWESYLVVARGAEGLAVLDVPLAGQLRDETQLSLADEVPGCDLASCEAVAVTIRAGRVFVAVRADEPFVGGLWTLSLRDPEAVVSLGVETLDRSVDGLGVDPIEGESFGDRLLGPLRVFGDYLAVGYRTSVATALGDPPEPTTVEVNRGVLIARHQGGEVTPCLRIDPRLDTSYSEVLVQGDQVVDELEQDPLSLPTRAPLEVYGDYLARGLDGWLVLDRVHEHDPASSLAAACADTLNRESEVAPADQRLPALSTDELAVGRHSLGLRSATSVQVAGAYAFVGMEQRVASLGQASFIDILRLEDRQLSTGAPPGGEPAALGRVGRIETRSVGPLYYDGTWLTVVGPSAVEVWEIFEPVGPRAVAAVGENPTGQNVAWGSYVVHQRALRGVGVWDLADPAAPTQTNPATCVPGCLEVQDLAGRAYIDGGYLFSPLNGDPDDPGAQDSLQIVDVGTDPAVLSTVATLVNDSALCGDSPVRGFATFEQHAFVGCEESDDVFWVNIADPEDGAQFTVGGSFSLGPDLQTRALAVGRQGEGGPAAPWHLFALTQTGAVVAFELVTAASPSSEPLIEPSSAPPLEPGFTFGHTLVHQGGRLYVLGGTSVDGCDPLVDPLGCLVTEHALRVYDLQSSVLLDEWSVVRDEVSLPDGTAVPLNDDAKLTLLATPGLVVIGRSASGLENRYELYRPSDLDGPPWGLAQPNALPLSATLVGGHLVPADMNIYALE